MATFLGEFGAPPSRAVDEDDDDDEMPQAFSSTVMRWTPEAKAEMEKSDTNTLRCNSLIISIGPAPTAFTETYVLGGQEAVTLGVMCSGMKDDDVNTLSQRSPTDKTCFVYRLRQRPEVIVVQCKSVVSPEQSYSWTEQLMSKISKETTYAAVLCTSGFAEYKQDWLPDDFTVPFLRALKSSTFRGTPVCPYLEQPNTVAGLPAQVLTYCEVNRVPVVLYQCYTDVTYLDIHTIKTFCPITTATPVKEFVKIHPQPDQKLRDLVDQDSHHNTSLYI